MVDQCAEAYCFIMLIILLLLYYCFAGNSDLTTIGDMDMEHKQEEIKK